MSSAKIYQLDVSFTLHSFSFSLHTVYETLGPSTLAWDSLISSIIGADIYNTA